MPPMKIVFVSPNDWMYCHTVGKIIPENLFKISFCYIFFLTSFSARPEHERIAYKMVDSPSTHERQFFLQIFLKHFCKLLSKLSILSAAVALLSQWHTDIPRKINTQHCSVIAFQSCVAPVYFMLVSLHRVIIQIRRFWLLLIIVATLNYCSDGDNLMPDLSFQIIFLRKTKTKVQSKFYCSKNSPDKKKRVWELILRAGKLV